MQSLLRRQILRPSLKKKKKKKKQGREKDCQELRDRERSVGAGGGLGVPRQFRKGNGDRG